MPSCQFSTIQVVPHDLGRYASANVGVILYDPSENIAYRKLTDNWQEVYRITGFMYKPGVAETAEQGPFDVEDNYLENLVKGQFVDSLRITPPRNLMHFDTHREALEWTYNSQVSIAAVDGKKDGRADAASALLREKIALVRFPKWCYKSIYTFDLGRPAAMQFPNVFFTDGIPYKALFAVSLSVPSSYATVKKRMCEVETIRRQAAAKPAFGMCTIQTKREIDMGRAYVRNSLDLAKEWDVESIPWDEVDGELAEIRGIVSPPRLYT